MTSAQSGRQAFGSLLQGDRVFVQRLYGQAPAGSGDAQAADDLVGEIEYRNGRAAQLFADFTVIESYAAAPDFGNFLS